MEENKEQKIPQGVKDNSNKQILPNVTQIKQKETFTLPSRGLLYDANDGIPESITLRRMTTKEEKIRLRNQSRIEVIRDLLQACIVNEGVDANKLKLVDANYLLFKLRVISLLDDTYKIRLRCPKCGAEFIHELNLSDVPIKYIEQDINEKLNITLPLSKQTVTLKYPSLGEIIHGGNKLEEYFDMFPNLDKNEVVIARTHMLYIKTINNQQVMFEELEDWYNNLDIIDYRELVKNLEKIANLYGFEDNLSGLCPKCQTEVKHGLPITDELFNPSTEDIG